MPPVVCMTNTYGATGTWIVCRADANSAWISAANGNGVFEPLRICNYLGFASVTATGGTCGTVCGYCGNGGSGCGTTSNAGYVFDSAICTVTCYRTVHWLCGNRLTSTVAPSKGPTAAPSTVAPSKSPTAALSSSPTVVPSSRPTAAPSSRPSTVPSTSPTAVPSSGPTAAPYELPSCPAGWTLHCGCQWSPP